MNYKFEGTAGPLHVTVSDKWPFRICTHNADGEVVFSRDMPAYSTSQKSAKQALDGLRMGEMAEEAKEANHKALADEILRAAAPELFEALKAILGPAEVMGAISISDAYHYWQLLGKATGENP